MMANYIMRCKEVGKKKELDVESGKNKKKRL